MAERLVKFLIALVSFIVCQALTIYLITLFRIVPRASLSSYVPIALLIGLPVILPFVIWSKPLITRIWVMPLVAFVTYMALVGPRIPVYLQTADGAFAMFMHSLQWLVAAAAAAVALDLRLGREPHRA